MKKVFLFIVLFVALGTVSLAQCTVDIFINGIKAGQVSLKANQATGGLSYKKSTYRNIDKLTIQIQGKSVDGGYYRKVQVIGDDVTPMLIASETVGAVGQFDITDKNIIKRLKNGKPITMYVEKTPANTKSTEAVSKVYLGTLTREK
jgi:DNA replicative helicase MCM subunit Mcm2 (Cdc46/Mcm family)